MTPALPTFEQLIKNYDLKPHPEGGYFKETYRSPEIIARSALPERFSGNRSFSTAIFYLLPEGAKSHFHRISADEVWHFYLGGPLVLSEILSDGLIRQTTLGQDIRKNHTIQHTVPAGTWFGAQPEEGSSYSFVGCTVAPGFDFADFKMGSRSQLLTQYPQARNIIEKLTDL